MRKELNFLQDTAFLREIDKQKIKVFYIKVIVYGPNLQYGLYQKQYEELLQSGDREAAEELKAMLYASQYEVPVDEIQGRVTDGSLSITATSKSRRSGNITFASEWTENDVTKLDNMFSLNKKVKIFIGIENHVDNIHDDILWFNQGVFVISNVSISHNINSVSINLQLQDKMALLDGTLGGTLPSLVDFGTYDQQIGTLDITENYSGRFNTYTVYKIHKKNIETGKDEVYNYMWDEKRGLYMLQGDLPTEPVKIKQRFFDIIQTAVCNYGGEAISNILISEVPLKIKQSVRWAPGADGPPFLYLSPIAGEELEREYGLDKKDGWMEFSENENCGYVYTDFTYPGEFKTGISSTVVTVLDNIIGKLGNHEYFYDENGRFIFREKKNYLNTMFQPLVKLDEQGFLLSENNYYADFSNVQKSIYTFDENSDLVSSYSNAFTHSSIKNDFYIWGKMSDSLALFYHVAVKEKPTSFTTRWVLPKRNLDGELDKEGRVELLGYEPSEEEKEFAFQYTPQDWRQELYMRGLEKRLLQQRPDIYEEELLDQLPTIYSFSDKVYYNEQTKEYAYCDFDSEIEEAGFSEVGYGHYLININNPNTAHYWIDFINPSELIDISVDTIGRKPLVVNDDNIKKIYDRLAENIMLINSSWDEAYQEKLKEEYENAGQYYAVVDDNIMDNIAENIYSYTAQDKARDLLYTNTVYVSGLNLSTIPIYYLDLNSRITIMRDGIIKLIKENKIDTIVIEDVQLNGFSNATARALLWLQGCLSVAIWEYNPKIEIIKIGPSSWRKVLGLTQGRGVTRDKQKKIDIEYAETAFNVSLGSSDDEADALCILAAYLKNATELAPLQQTIKLPPIGSEESAF